MRSLATPPGITTTRDPTQVIDALRRSVSCPRRACRSIDRTDPEARSRTTRSWDPAGPVPYARYRPLGLIDGSSPSAMNVSPPVSRSMSSTSRDVARFTVTYRSRPFGARAMPLFVYPGIPPRSLTTFPVTADATSKSFPD
jgi:hypothetical protein